jgi:hypothetical protein
VLLAQPASSLVAQALVTGKIKLDRLHPAIGTQKALPFGDDEPATDLE